MSSYITWPEPSDEFAPPPASLARARASSAERRVTALALSFFMLFAAFSTAQLLESSLNGPSGLVCLFEVYGSFSISAALSPWFISRAGGSPTTAMAIAAVPYVLLVTMNLLPFQIGWLKQCACIGVGAGAGPLWAAQGVYIGAAAAAHVATAAAAVAPVTDSLSTTASALNARFYSIFMLSGFSSNAVASIIMLTVPEPALAVRILFAFLTLAASVGVIGMFLIETASAPGSNVFRRLSDISAAGTKASDAGVAETPHGGGEAGVTEARTTAGSEEPKAPQKAHVLTVLCLIRNDSRLWLLLPAAFAQGSSAGFFMGTWLALAVAASVGQEFVGIAGAVFAGCAVSSSRLWARLASLKHWGRRWSFVVATLVAIVWSAGTALSWRASSRIATPPTPTLSLVAQALISVAVLSITDPVFSAFLPATIQTFFTSKVDLAAGVAATKVAYCIGFATQQLTSLSFFYFLGSAELAAQSLIICLLFCAAGAALLWLHFKIPNGHLDSAMQNDNVPG